MITSDRISAFDVVLTHGFVDATISGNTCTDTGGIESDNASGGLADSEMRDVTISGNTVSANRAAGIGPRRDAARSQTDHDLHH